MRRSHHRPQVSGLASQRACLAALDALRQASFTQYRWCLRLRASGWNMSLQHRHLREAVELIGRRKMHRQPTAFSHRLGRKSSPRPPHEEDREEDPEEDAGRRVFLEVFEEDPTQAPSDVQVAHFIGFL